MRGPLRLRANPWSDGAGLDLARARGAARHGGLDEFYGRVMPAPPARIARADFVPLAQLYGREARVARPATGEFFTPPGSSWSRERPRQATARLRARAPGTCSTRPRSSARPSSGRTSGSRRRARRAARCVEREDGTLAVHVAAAVTHTIGGLRVDADARVLGADGHPLGGLWAAGVDAGGVATGGYASGLAQALVLGLAAAESVAAA